MKSIISLLCCVFLMGNQAFCTPLNPSDFIANTASSSVIRPNYQFPLINHEHLSIAEDRAIKSLEPIFVKLKNIKVGIIEEAPWALQGLYDIIYSFDNSEGVNYSEKGNMSFNKHNILKLLPNISHCYLSSFVTRSTVLFLQEGFTVPASIVSPKTSCRRRSCADDNLPLKISLNDSFIKNRAQKLEHSGNLMMKPSKSDSNIYLHKNIASFIATKPCKSLRQPTDVIAVFKGKPGTANVVNEIILKSIKNKNVLKKGEIARLESVLLYGNHACGLLLSADYHLFDFLVLVKDKRYLLLFLVFNEYMLNNLFPGKGNNGEGLGWNKGGRGNSLVSEIMSVLRNPGINNLVKALISDLLPLNNDDNIDKKFKAVVNITKLPVLVEKEFIDKETFLDMLDVYLALSSIAFMRTKASSVILTNKKYNVTRDTTHYPRYLYSTISDVPVTSASHNKCSKGCRKKCSCVLI